MLMTCIGHSLLLSGQNLFLWLNMANVNVKRHLSEAGMWWDVGIVELGATFALHVDYTVVTRT